jgi:glycolate oxidase iron-sulfur subunit
MHVDLAAEFKGNPQAESAAAQIRACVHCGFCNATCPTYELLKDELDGPRGRIYQIKTVLEGKAPTVKMQKHLDRCLNCLACETTCPSGVRYGRLLDLGRKFVDLKIQRPWPERLLRLGLRTLLPYPNRLAPWVRSALTLQALLPKALASRLPPRSLGAWPAPVHRRRMVVLDGCVQAVLAPQINLAAARPFRSARHFASARSRRWLLRRVELSLRRQRRGA